jgi:ADP-ribosylglycohydrolase
MPQATQPSYQTPEQNAPIQYDLLLPIISNDYYAAIAGLIYGCALGDNLGLQAEGKTLDEVKKMQIVDQPNKDYKGIEKNDWTDDTDQLVLLMEAIGETNGNTINIKTFINSLIKFLA